MSSWEDHEEMIDDQYLMESIEEDQKLDTGASKGGEDDELEDEQARHSWFIAFGVTFQAKTSIEAVTILVS